MKSSLKVGYNEIVHIKEVNFIAKKTENNKANKTSLI